MPKNAKMAPPAAAKTARTAVAARHARNAARLRSAGESEVIATKMGAAEIGLMTEKRDENARNANCWSEGVSIVGRIIRDRRIAPFARRIPDPPATR